MATEKDMNERYRSRRFVLTVVCSMTYTALLVGGYLDQGSYVALQMMTIGAYLAANGWQKHMEITTNGKPTS